MHLFLNRPFVSVTFSELLKYKRGNLALILIKIQKRISEIIASWEMTQVLGDLCLRTIDKRKAPRERILQHFLHLRQNYRHTKFYTDAAMSAFLGPVPDMAQTLTSQ